VRTIFGLTVGILVASFPALSQAGCEDSVALQEVATQYFGLGEYQGMTETQIRQKLSESAEMQHWRDWAHQNGVGEAIANWIVAIDTNAAIAAQHMAKKIKTEPISYEPKSRKYTCVARFDFDDPTVIPYLTLVTFNSWLRQSGAGGLDALASDNEMKEWQAAERLLSYRLREIAELTAPCVRKQVAFTERWNAAALTIDLDAKPAIDQECVMKIPPLQ
jgi:hypothetical protein